MQLQGENKCQVGKSKSHWFKAKGLLTVPRRNFLCGMGFYRGDCGRYREALSRMGKGEEARKVNTTQVVGAMKAEQAGGGGARNRWRQMNSEREGME